MTMTEEMPTEAKMMDERGSNVSSSFDQQFKNWISKIKKGEKIAIFTHFHPDPDAIGSAMGMVWLFDKLGIESECFFSGSVSHPQNLAMCNLLSPISIPVEKYDINEFKHAIMVDCCPDNENAGVGICSPSSFGFIIDHHKFIPNNGFSGIYVNLQSGSCCGAVYTLIKALGFNFEDDNTADSKVATALMVGIVTDTDGLLADSCTEYEFNAYSELFEFRNDNALREIIKYKRPKFWVTKKAEATKDAVIDDDGVAIVGVGLLPEKHYNLIADIADEMISWASVEMAVCFAVINGEKLVGSVRSINASVDIPMLCNRLGGKFGGGGGREGKGSYYYSIQGLAIEDDEDEETKKEMWATINRKEIKRIRRVVNN